MVSDKSSPRRRKSIAGIHVQPSIVPKNRRRAHSIVPAVLSPLSKARRSLVPRKSILKASISNLNFDSSSQPTNQSQSPDDATESMDMTEDLTSAVRIAPRKSIGRRVSFAADSHVRLIDNARRRSSIRVRRPSITEEQDVSNENGYPSQNSRRRRSSIRQSIGGSDDMDLTTVMPSGFEVSGSAILDEEFGYGEDEYGEGDMDVTQAVNGDFALKRSLSMGGRRSSAGIIADHDSYEENESRSDAGNSSYISETASEQSEHSQLMEFTIPLGQPLRPAQQDEAWLALKQMTHSGNEPSEPELSSDDNEHRGEDMDLQDAMERLQNARNSFPFAQPNEFDEFDDGHNDTFSSTEDSFNDNGDDNKTLNLSQVMGRASLVGSSRPSIGEDSNMDESEVYGYVAASTPRQSLTSQGLGAPAPVSEDGSEKPEAFPVFQPSPQPSEVTPTEAEGSGRPLKPRKSVTFSLIPQGPSSVKMNSNPSTVKARPSFTAAFAPPTARSSPKKSTSTPTDPHVTPSKRPRVSTPLQHEDIENVHSPAKRQAMAGKWISMTEQEQEDPTSSPIKSATSLTAKPRPLSPSKKAPFQPSASSDPTNRASSALRRPSGYFARRSLAVGVTPSTESGSALDDPSTTIKPGVKHGRMSMGSVPSDAWLRSNKDAESGTSAVPRTSSTKGKEKEVDEHDREAEKRVRASPTPSHGSPMKITPPKLPLTQSSISREPSPTRRVIFEPQAEELLAPEETELSGHPNVDIDATQQWRDGVEQPEEEQEEVPSISIAQFFSMTGIKFMDELTAPRRSMHPSKPMQQSRSFADIPLAEYATAMAIDIPQSDLYSRVCKDLEGWITKSKIVFTQAEEEAEKVTPELFVEYVRADEEGQAELLHHLNLIRTHTRYMARSDWYDWRLQWVEGLSATAEAAFHSLENDARALEEPKRIATDVIPALEKEYEELIRELEQERAEVAEIEEGDQDYLNELKATIAEQNIEIEALKAELTEGTEQVRSLQEHIEEMESQEREAKNKITTAERILRSKQSSIRFDVFRLKAELEVLEDLHMCRITKVHSAVFEYVYASLFYVSIPCNNFVPNPTKVTITRHGKDSTRYKDDFPNLSFFLSKVARLLITDGDYGTVREIVHRLCDFWSSCAQLRSQLLLVSIKYPVEIIPGFDESGLPSLKVRTMVMFPSVKGKAFISFVFSFDTLCQWPLTIDSLYCEVDVAYGRIDHSAILKAVSTRLSQATISDNYACLLDSCIEAQDVYH